MNQVMTSRYLQSKQSGVFSGAWALVDTTKDNDVVTPLVKAFWSAYGFTGRTLRGPRVSVPNFL